MPPVVTVSNPQSSHLQPFVDICSGELLQNVIHVFGGIENINATHVVNQCVDDAQTLLNRLTEFMLKVISKSEFYEKAGDSCVKFSLDGKDILVFPPNQTTPCLAQFHLNYYGNKSESTHFYNTTARKLFNMTIPNCPCNVNFTFGGNSWAAKQVYWWPSPYGEYRINFSEIFPLFESFFYIAAQGYSLTQVCKNRCELPSSLSFAQFIENYYGRPTDFEGFYPVLAGYMSDYAIYYGEPQHLDTRLKLPYLNDRFEPGYFNLAQWGGWSRPIFPYVKNFADKFLKTDGSILKTIKYLWDTRYKTDYCKNNASDTFSCQSTNQTLTQYFFKKLCDKEEFTELFLGSITHNVFAFLMKHDGNKKYPNIYKAMLSDCNPAFLQPELLWWP